MLIHRIDAETLKTLCRVNEEVAGRLKRAQTDAFANEAEAEAYLWGIVGLMQEQAGLTARVLTAAIDARDAAANEQRTADAAVDKEERS